MKPMRVVKILLAIIIISIVIGSIINPMIAWIVLLLLGPLIQLFLGPIIVTVKLFYIVYLSFYASLIISIFSIAVLRKFISKSYFVLAAVFSIFWLVHVPYSIYLGERHIHGSAIEKNSSEAHEVNINLGGWYKLSQGNYMGLPGHDSHLGNPHGYIYRDSKKCNWSFMKDNFICPRS